MLARSVTINLAGRVGSLVLGFIASLLIARWLGPADRGLLALLLSVSMMAWVGAAVGIPMAVLYYASRPGASTQRLLGTTLAVAAVLTLVLVPLAAVVSGPLADAFAHGRGGLLWVLAAAYVPILFLDSTTHNQLLARLQFTRFNALSVAGRFASLVLAVVLVGVVGLGVAGGLLATIAASVVMVVGSLWTLRREGRPRFDGALLKTLMKYGIRVQANNVFQNLNYRLDVIVLQLFRPLAEVGYYVVSQVIAELVLVLADSFQSSVIPLVAGAEGADRDGTTVLAIRHHGLLAAAACVANAGIGTLLIVFGYGSAYKPAVVPMLILLPGIWWLGTGSLVTTNLRARGRPGTASAVSGVAVVATVTLDLVLIPPFGVVGAAVASVIAYTLQGVLSLIVLSRVAGIPVRTLVVPDHDDLRAYPTAARLLVLRMRGQGTRVPEGG
jgi:O-antigen/teichoic acid export membrane protein